MLTRKKQTIFFLIVIFFFSIAGICFDGQQTGPGSFEKEIQAKLDSLQQEKKFPGATVGIVLVQEGKVFSPVLLEEMLKPVDFRTGVPGKQGYGLGVMIFNRPFGLIYGHGGFFPVYETQMSYFPKWKIALTVQVNADSLSGKLDGSLNQFIEQLVPILEKYFKK